MPVGRGEYEAREVEVGRVFGLERPQRAAHDFAAPEAVEVAEALRHAEDACEQRGKEAVSERGDSTCALRCRLCVGTAGSRKGSAVSVRIFTSEEAVKWPSVRHDGLCGGDAPSVFPRGVDMESSPVSLPVGSSSGMTSLSSG
eukprot:7389412-Prymnesium_polylepis.1